MSGSRRVVATHRVPRVAVIGHVPVLSAGLSVILRQEGFDPISAAGPRSPDEDRHWGPDTEEATSESGTYAVADAVVFAAYRSEELSRLAVIVAAYPEAAIVVMLRSPDPLDHIAILRDGATALVDWIASPEELARTLRAALAGEATLPISVARRLADGTGRPALDLSLSQDELVWLRVLAAGASVSQLATRENYSEREMFRRLSDLYRRLGVRRRSEAIALVAGRGLLPDPRSRQDSPRGCEAS